MPNGGPLASPQSWVVIFVTPFRVQSQTVSFNAGQYYSVGRSPAGIARSLRVDTTRSHTKQLIFSLTSYSGFFKVITKCEACRGLNDERNKQ